MSGRRKLSQYKSPYRKRSYGKKKETFLVHPPLRRNDESCSEIFPKRSVLCGPPHINLWDVSHRVSLLCFRERESYMCMDSICKDTSDWYDLSYSYLLLSDYINFLENSLETFLFLLHLTTFIVIIFVTEGTSFMWRHLCIWTLYGRNFFLLLNICNFPHRCGMDLFWYGTMTGWWP